MLLRITASLVLLGWWNIVLGNPVTASRQRRTLGVLCGSEQFADALVRTIMDQTRDVLKNTEPLNLGDGPRSEAIALREGRLWGASTVHLRSPIGLRCDDDSVVVRLHVALNNTEILYNWDATPKDPDDGPKGTVALFARQLGINAVFRMPKPETRTASHPIQVLQFDLADLHGADFNVTGVWPYTHLLSSIFNVLVRTFPNEAKKIVSAPLKENLQKYLDQSALTNVV